MKIYILTHKKFNYDGNTLYEPLLNGSALLNDDFGYTRDDTGDNISKLNPYYAELTGEYWAWKNSDVDVIGFCHYRRYFVKNIFLKRIEKEDIYRLLNKYDIILPKKRHNYYSNIDKIKLANEGGKILEGGTCEKVEDYTLLRRIIEEKSPEYLNSFDEFLNDTQVHYFNMFICKKELADDYFSWLFEILNEFKIQNDFSGYDKNNMRVLGYLSEKLLNVYVRYHNLKVKENYVVSTEARFPIIPILEFKSPIFQKLIMFVLNFKK